MATLFLTCDCGAAEPLARGAAEEAGLTDWLNLRIHKGKEHCLTVLSHFSAPYKGLLAFQALEEKISQGGSFVTVVGYDDEYFYWADLASNAPADRFDAISIIKRFA